MSGEVIQFLSRNRFLSSSGSRGRGVRSVFASTVPRRSESIARHGVSRRKAIPVAHALLAQAWASCATRGWGPPSRRRHRIRPQLALSPQVASLPATGRLFAVQRAAAKLSMATEFDRAESPALARHSAAGPFRLGIRRRLPPSDRGGTPPRARSTSLKLSVASGSVEKSPPPRRTGTSARSTRLVSIRPGNDGNDSLRSGRPFRASLERAMGLGRPKDHDQRLGHDRPTHRGRLKVRDHPTGLYLALPRSTADPRPGSVGSMR